MPAYYDALMRVRMSNDLIHWVRFFLQGVAETAAKGRETFHKILMLRTEAEQSLLHLGKRAPNARLALNLLYRHPIVSAMDFEQKLAVSTPTAHTLIRELEKLNLLREVTGQQRGRLYTFERYLNLFIS